MISVIVNAWNYADPCKLIHLTCLFTLKWSNKAYNEVQADGDCVKVGFPLCSLFYTHRRTTFQKPWLLCFRTLGSALFPKRPQLLGQAPVLCLVKILSNQQHQPNRLYGVQKWWLCRSLHSAGSSEPMQCCAPDDYPGNEPVVWLRMFPDIWICSLFITLILDINIWKSKSNNVHVIYCTCNPKVVLWVVYQIDGMEVHYLHRRGKKKLRCYLIIMRSISHNTKEFCQNSNSVNYDAS